MKLKVIYDGKDYYRGDFLKVKGSNVQIEHITENGFLFNKSAPNTDEYVVMNDGKGGMTTYYKNWDYSVFVKCDVEACEI